MEQDPSPQNLKRCTDAINQMKEQLTLLNSEHPHPLFYPNRIKYWNISMTEAKSLIAKASDLVGNYFEGIELPDTPEQKKIKQLTETIEKLQAQNETFKKNNLWLQVKAQEADQKYDDLKKAQQQNAGKQPESAAEAVQLETLQIENRQLKQQIAAMKQLFSETLLPENKLIEVAKQQLKIEDPTPEQLNELQILRTILLKKPTQDELVEQTKDLTSIPFDKVDIEQLSQVFFASSYLQ